MALKTIVGASVVAIMLAPAAQAHEGKYVTNSAGEAVKNSAGECVQAAYGNAPEECGGEVASVYVFTVPETPAPRRAPVVIPKVKAKGNYKGAVQMDPASRSVMQNYQK